MQVTVRLFAMLGEGRLPEQVLDLADGATVTDVIGLLGIAPERVTVTFINGRHAEHHERLAEGDRLALFPPVGGG